jgi:hypothetical protein
MSALYVTIGMFAVFAFAVAWRLDTAFQPFDEAFSDFTETDHPTDADLLQRLYGSEGTGCEAAFHSKETKL